MNHRPTSTFMKLTHLPLALITGLLGVSAAFAETVRLDSPDRHLELTLEVPADGGVTHSLTVDGKTLILPSPVGFFFSQRSGGGI